MFREGGRRQRGAAGGLRLKRSRRRAAAVRQTGDRVGTEDEFGPLKKSQQQVKNKIHCRLSLD